MFTRLSECGLLPGCVSSPWFHDTDRPLSTGRGGAGSGPGDVHHSQRHSPPPPHRDERQLPQYHSEKVSCVSETTGWIVWFLFDTTVPRPLPPGLKAVRASTSQPAAVSSPQLASCSPNLPFSTKQLTCQRNKCSPSVLPLLELGSATIICGQMKFGQTESNSWCWPLYSVFHKHETFDSWCSTHEIGEIDVRMVRFVGYGFTGPHVNLGSDLRKKQITSIGWCQKCILIFWKSRSLFFVIYLLNMYFFSLVWFPCSLKASFSCFVFGVTQFMCE